MDFIEIQIEQLDEYRIQEYKIYVVNNSLIIPTKSNLILGMYMKYKTRWMNCAIKIPYEIYISLDNKQYKRIYLYKDIFYDLIKAIRAYLRASK